LMCHLGRRSLTRAWLSLFITTASVWHFKWI